MFDINGVLLVAGERAPFMRSTWNQLRDRGHVEFYKPAGKGRGRCRVTVVGNMQPCTDDPAFDVPACFDRTEEEHA